MTGLHIARDLWSSGPKTAISEVDNFNRGKVRPCHFGGCHRPGYSGLVDARPGAVLYRTACGQCRTASRQVTRFSHAIQYTSNLTALLHAVARKRNEQVVKGRQGRRKRRDESRTMESADRVWKFVLSRSRIASHLPRVVFMR